METEKPKLTLADILEGLKNSDPEIRKKYLLVLARIDKPQIVKYIIPLLEDESDEIRSISQKLINHFNDKYQLSSNNEKTQENNLISDDRKSTDSQNSNESNQSIPLKNDLPSAKLENKDHVETNTQIFATSDVVNKTENIQQKISFKNQFLNKIKNYYRNSNNKKAIILAAILVFYFLLIHVYLIYSIGFTNSSILSRRNVITEEMLIKDIEGDIDVFVADINKYLEELIFIQDKTEWFANNLSPIINKFSVVKKFLALNKKYKILKKTAAWTSFVYVGKIFSKLDDVIESIEKLNKFVLLIENNKKKCHILQSDFQKYKANPDIKTLYSITDDISKGFLTTAEEIIENLDLVQNYLQSTIDVLEMAIDAKDYAGEKYAGMMQKLKFWETATEEVSLDTTGIKTNDSASTDESVLEDLKKRIKEWNDLIANFKANFKKDREIIGQIKASVNVHKRYIK